MTLNDPELREIVRNSIPVEINNKSFIVEEAKGVNVTVVTLVVN